MDSLVLFEQKQVRRMWNEATQKWYFAVQDVIEILTGSADIKQYVKKLKSRDPELSSNWGTICTLVELTNHERNRNPTPRRHLPQKLAALEALKILASSGLYGPALDTRHEKRK